MQWRRKFVAFGIALLVAALAAPVAAMCCNGCPCPMAKLKGSTCATGSTVGPTLSCCSRPPAAEVSQVPSAVAAPQVEAPAPTEHPIAAAPAYALATSATSAPKGHVLIARDRARAEWRHDRGLCVLNSVFLN